MKENKKKLDWKNFVIVIILGLLIFCVFKMDDMSENISMLEIRVANFQSGVRSEIKSIYNNVDELLKKQASLVSSVEYSLGELDTATHTVPLTLKVVPKMLADDITLSVRIGNTTADLTRNDNEFIAIVPVGLFINDEQYPILSIKAGNETKTEKLESVVVTNLHYDYLPNIYAHISPFYYNFSNGKLKIDSELYLSVYCGSATVTKMELITEINGEEIERQDMISYAQNEDCEIAYNKTYRANEGDELVIYLISEDSLGYIHKTTTLYWKQKDGAIESIADKGGEIYDKNGNLLTK